MPSLGDPQERFAGDELAIAGTTVPGSASFPPTGKSALCTACAEVWRRHRVVGQRKIDGACDKRAAVKWRFTSPAG